MLDVLVRRGRRLAGEASLVSRSGVEARLGHVDVVGRGASHSMRRRRDPVEPTAQMAPIMAVIACRTQRGVLAWNPFLIRETVNGVAPVAEAARPERAVDTGS